MAEQRSAAGDRPREWRSSDLNGFPRVSRVFCGKNAEWPSNVVELEENH
jgi:hypothetical protein